MEEILTYISAHWLEWLFALIVAGLASVQHYTIRRLKSATEEYKVIRNGIQALLRDSIVATYNKYKERGGFPIYARESMKKVYEAYTDLDGNDVAHDLYDKMRNWDTDPDDADKQKMEQKNES